MTHHGVLEADGGVRIDQGTMLILTNVDDGNNATSLWMVTRAFITFKKDLIIVILKRCTSGYNKLEGGPSVIGLVMHSIPRSRSTYISMNPI